MQTLSTPCVQDIPVFNLLSVLDGKIINDAGYSVDRLSGEVTIAVPQSNPNLLFPGPESIVIVGEQPDVARRAIEQNVNCLIVCQAGLPEELLFAHPEACVRVPMRSQARSLNLSNTVAVGVYEALRQWGFPQLQSAGRLTRFSW